MPSEQVVQSMKNLDFYVYPETTAENIGELLVTLKELQRKELEYGGEPIRLSIIITLLGIYKDQMQNGL